MAVYCQLSSNRKYIIQGGNCEVGYCVTKDVVLLGDFNMNLLKTIVVQKFQTFIDILQSNFLMPTVILRY